MALLFQTLGTPTNTAIHKYVNQQKVPHLFVATGATKWNDPKNFPWTMGFQPNYQTEGRVYAALYPEEPSRTRRSASCIQNDDYGKDYLKGIEDGLGAAAAKLIVLKQSYEVTDPTIDSQIINLKNSGANVFFNVTIPKFAVQAIKKAHDIGWKPTHFLNNVSSSLATVLKPAGPRGLQGPHHRAVHEGSHRSAVEQRQGIHGLGGLHEEVLSGRRLDDQSNAYGYNVADPHDPGPQAVRQRPVAREHHEAGGRPQERRAPAAAARDQGQYEPRPTTRPIEQEQLAKFDGERWVLFGEIFDAFRK